MRLAADDSVELGANGSIDVSGRRLNLAGAPVDVAGGAVQVVGRNGAVNFLAGSRVDVSSGNGTAGAGSLGILGGGAVSLAGDLAGHRAGRGAQRQLRADRRVARRLHGAQPDAERRRLRLDGAPSRRCPATWWSRPARRSRPAKVTLAASGGNLTVAGRIDAQAAGGGTVLLAARDDLTLAGGAEIDARATAAGEGAGQVTVSSSDGDVSLQSGSRIRLDGYNGEAGGELLVRAGATADDLRVAEFGASVEGAVRTILAPVLRSDPVETLDGFVTESLRSLLDAFMAVAPANIRSRLGLGPDTLIRPALEVVADNDLTVAEDWDLATGAGTTSPAT